MVRVAAVPSEKNDPFKPEPPVEEPAEVLELAAPDVEDEAVAEGTSTSEPAEETKEESTPAPAKLNKESTEEKAADDQPAPLMQDQGAKPIKDQPEKAGTGEKEGDDTEAAADETEPKVLSPEVMAMQPRIRRVLDYYYKTQPVDTTRNDVWEAMHGFLPWGVDAQARTSEYRQPVNAIGWICWNKPCRGNQLFEIKNGKLAARQGPRVQGHHGQFLAMLAQSYVGPSYEIKVNGQTFTVQDLIEFEKETCVPRSELTFKLMALSYYLPADATWKSRDGQTWDLERLLREEITQKVVGAACGGTHRLTGIAFAVAARKKAGLPMDGAWAKAEDYINDYHKYTFQIQNPDGSFSTEWFEGRGMDQDVDRRLQTTGHILEFLIYSLPPEKLTSPEVVRAVNYLTSILERNPRRQWSIGPKGHALHALVLYDQLVFGTKPGTRRAEILQTSHD